MRIEMVMIAVSILCGVFWFCENDPTGAIGVGAWIQAVGVGLMFLAGGFLWRKRGRQGLIR